MILIHIVAFLWLLLVPLCNNKMLGFYFGEEIVHKCSTSSAENISEEERRRGMTNMKSFAP